VDPAVVVVAVAAVVDLKINIQSKFLFSLRGEKLNYKSVAVCC